MIDMKPRDFLLKSPLALCVLERLINNHGKTYVHCTAGIYRSPQLIALFLIKHRHFSLEETLEVFRNKRPFAKPIPYLIKMCLAHTEVEPEKCRRRAHTINF
jgi:protein-tyrosine phosphatase